MTPVGRLSLKQLRAFVAVYRLGSLSGAAKALGVTQSAVSVLLHQVEATLDTRLFDRTTRRLAPTPPADEAIDVAERILQDVGELEANFRARAELQLGRVRIAVTPAVGAAVLPRAVQAFRRAHPNVSVEIEDCAPNEFLPLVLNAQVDFGVGTPDGDVRGELHVQPLFAEPLCLVCPKGHALAARPALPWREVVDQPLILGRPGYGVRRAVDRTLAQQNLSVRAAFEARFVGSVLWMVAAGLGVAILPTGLVPAAQFPELVLVPLAEPTVAREVSVVTRRGRSVSAAAKAFIGLLSDTVESRAAPT